MWVGQERYRQVCFDPLHDGMGISQDLSRKKKKFMLPLAYLDFKVEVKYLVCVCLPVPQCTFAK